MPSSSELGELLPELSTPPPGPRSRALADRLRAVESRNVTWLADDFPVFWEEARGANVRDADGNVYLDLTGAFGVAAVGHGNERVAVAVAEQARRVAHGMGDVHPPTRKLELLERLAGLAPWPETRTVLASTGSEAVEIALKTAQLATGRPGILAFEGGYHGMTLGALAATHREDFRGPFRERLHQGVAFAPFPEDGDSGPSPGQGSSSEPRSGGDGDALSEALADVRRLLAEGVPGGARGGGGARTGADRIGAVIVEPIQGRAGVRIPAPGFLEGVAEAARDAGAVLIFDEVFTGFGRTGRRFAFEHEGVVPDLLCVGKALGGGFPVSACMGSEEVMRAWPPSEGEALHTSTFLGHPAGCAAALAALAEIENRELVARSRELGAEMLKGLREGLRDVAHVRDVRGRGLLLAVELCRPERGERLPGAAGPEGPPPWEGAGARVAAVALGRGLMVLPAGREGHVVELAPPLVLTREQAEWGVRTLVEVVRSLGDAP